MMPRPAGSALAVDPRTQLGRAILRALAAFDRADLSEMDSAYQAATRLAAGDPGLWLEICVDHVARLFELNQFDLALRRCTDYLNLPGRDRVALRLPRAEILSALGRHDEATGDTKWIRAELDNRLGSLSEDDRARLLRVEGLAAVESGDRRLAELRLDEARDGFRSAGNGAGVAQIEDDLRTIAVSRGEPAAAAEILSGPPPRTPVDHLVLAMAHKSELRYEEALGVLTRLLERDDLDPALRLRAKYERLLLLLLTRQERAADALLGELRGEVTAADDPELADALRRLSTGDVPVAPVSARFDRGVAHVRRLIADDRLRDAESLLADLYPKAETDRDVSTWHLIAGQLELARPAAPANLWTAVGHLETAAERAELPALAEVRVLARRLLGTVRFQLGEPDAAMDLWHQAHALEDEIAEKQLTDVVRVGMLAASPTEHDLLVDAVAARHDANRPETTATIVVAMEAARRATLLERLAAEGERATIVPGLPSPTDLSGAKTWLHETTRGLPRDQAIWMMHPVSQRVHHTLIGRGGFLRHHSVPVDEGALAAAVAEHVGWRGSKELLVASITNGAFERTLDRIAELIGLGPVLTELPPHIARIALAPARELAEIPFAAMSIGGGPDRVGHRFALSHLVCLSARRPLHDRSRRQRGHAKHHPPATELTEPGLRTALASRAHQILRIDSHGEFGEQGFRGAWIQLADGQLHPEALQAMDMRGCGTVVLGACESGMAERRGREERLGFVRAALLAGSASVIAAAWVAHDRVGAAVLDRFEHYLRYLPRDVALHRAQVDVCDGVSGTPTEDPFFGHPAYWACWELYGDPGFQTRAGPIRRRLRATLDAWRNRDR